jgi:hypothetical protein
MARVYAGWGLSQAFHSDQVCRELGYSSLEDFLVGFGEGFFLDGCDADNLLTMLWTWQNGDIGQTPGFDGDHVKALESIRAKAMLARVNDRSSRGGPSSFAGLASAGGAAVGERLTTFGSPMWERSILSRRSGFVAPRSHALVLR